MFKDKDGKNERSIPQIRKDAELCPSVLRLAPYDKAIHLLDGLSVLSHRISVLKGMVDSECDGIRASNNRRIYQYNAFPSCKTISQPTLSGKALWC